MNGLPWLEKKSQKLTLKIEVCYIGKLILLRFVHYDKFFKIEYNKIILRIVHNMI